MGAFETGALTLFGGLLGVVALLLTGAVSCAHTGWTLDSVAPVRHKSVLQHVAGIIRLAGHAVATASLEASSFGYPVIQLREQTVGVSWVGTRSPADEIAQDERLKRMLRLCGYAIEPSGHLGVSFMVRAANNITEQAVRSIA